MHIRSNEINILLVKWRILFVLFTFLFRIGRQSPPKLYQIKNQTQNFFQSVNNNNINRKNNNHNHANHNRNKMPVYNIIARRHKVRPPSYSSSVFYFVFISFNCRILWLILKMLSHVSLTSIMALSILLTHTDKPPFNGFNRSTSYIRMKNFH